MTTHAQKKLEQSLVDAIQAFLAVKRARERQMAEDCQIGYSDSYADVVLGRDEDGSLLLTYDGAGHSAFSYSAREEVYCLMVEAAEEFGFEPPSIDKIKLPRDELRYIAGQFGFIIEDQNTWRMIFVFEGLKKDEFLLDERKENEVCVG